MLFRRSSKPSRKSAPQPKRRTFWQRLSLAKASGRSSVRGHERLEDRSLLAATALNLTGDGTAIVVNLDTTTVTGGGLGTVDFSGAGTVNLNAAGGAVTVADANASTNLAVTSTGSQDATVEANGNGLVVNVTGAAVAALTADLTGGGASNTLTIDGAAAGQTFTATNTTVQDGTNLLVNYTAAQLTQLAVDGTGGGNSLVVDSTAAAVATPIVYNGGSGAGNSLTLSGGTATSDTYTPGPNGGQGSDTLVIGGTTETVTFKNLTPVTDNVAGALVVNGTTGDDAITAGASANTVSVNNLESITFSNKTSLTLNGNGGNDTFNVTPTNLSLGGGAVSVHGAVAANDTLTVNGRVNTADSITYTPATSTSDTGSVAITGLPTVNFTGTAGLTINGQNGGPGGAGDSLTINTSNLSSNQTEILTPGNTFDSGHIDFRDRPGGVNPIGVPLDFSGLGVAGSVSFTDVGRFDNLVYNGTSRNDTFTVNAAGQVVLNSQVPVSTSSIHTVTLAGLGGNDTFNVAGNNNLPGNGGSAGVVIEGSDPASNVLNFTGDGTGAVSVVSAQTVTEAGFAPMSFSGVATVNVNAGGKTLTVTGTSGSDTLAATPTSASAVSFQAYQSGDATSLASLTPIGPAFNATNVSTAAGGFSINGNGGSDTLFVEGTQNADTIDVNDAVSGANAVQVSGLLAVNYNAALPHIEVDGLAGSDAINVAPSTTTSFVVDGGDPIGVQPGDTINLIHPPGPYQLVTGPTTDSGGLNTPGFQAVSWAHIETVVNTGGGAPIITGTNGNDEITVIARDSSYNPSNPGVPNPLLDGVQDFTVSVNGGPDMLFVNTPNVFIDGKSGCDNIAVQESAPNQAVWNVQVYVAGGNPLGDNIELQTPGTQSVTFNPNNPLSAVPAVAGVTFSSPNEGGGQFNDTTDTSTVTATQFLLPGFYQSSSGGADHFIYAGDAGNDTLTYNTPAGAGSNLVYAPGATSDSGTITGTQSGGAALTPFSFSGLGSSGSVSFSTSNAGRTDSLVLDGTVASDTFNVTGSGGGTVTLNNQVAVTTPGVANLTLSGQGGSDQFNLAGALPYTNTTVDGGSVVNLSGATGPVTINEGDNSAASNTSITGFGGKVTLIGAATANVDAGNQNVAAVGTSQNDNFIYTPTGSAAGTFYDSIASGNGLVSNTVFNLTNVSGDLTMFGGSGGNADEVTVEATAARDLVEIDQATAVATVLANNVNGLLPVQLAANVAILNALGEGGQNTFQVIPAAGLGGSPDNLLVNINGGSGTGANNALVLANSFGSSPATLPATSFVVENRGQDLDSGTIRVYESAVANPDINYTTVQVVSPLVATSGTPNGNLLIIGSDTNEPNGTLPTATNLGSASNIEVSNATIFAGTEFPGVPANSNYYSVTAQQTGMLDLTAAFNLYNSSLLPGGGQLNVQVLNAAGHVIADAAGGASTYGTEGATGDASIRVGVIAGQTYFIHVFGANANGTANDTVVNGYNLSIANTPTNANAQNFVAVYQDVLGRTPDASALAYWTQLLNQGWSVSSVAEAILHSPEYYANFVIKPAYQNLLGRAADAAGLAFWTQKLQNGLTDQQLQAGFIASDEFYANAGGTNKDWIDAVYQKLLNRTADSTGETFWLGKLSAGASRSDVALSITNGAEYDATLITADYQHYLNRTPGATSLNYWLQQLQDDQTNADVIAAITGSAEYLAEHTS